MNEAQEELPGPLSELFLESNHGAGIGGGG
jgi:hypothetical protein